MRRIQLGFIVLALLAISLPAFAGDRHDDRKVEICHVPPGNPANGQVITVDEHGWDGHDKTKHAHELDFLVESYEDRVRCNADYTTTTTSTTTTVPEETTTTAPEATTTTLETTTTLVPSIEVCVIAEGRLATIPFDQYEKSLHERIWDDFDRRDCEPLRTPTSTTIPVVVIPGPIYSVGYICPGTDGVVHELPWGTAEDMWPTPELAKAYGCPPSPTTTVVLTELPFTGVDSGLVALVGLSLLGLGTVAVRSARSDG